ncbi:PREDICTED: probable disease resistance protein RPP1 [Camelina sativa]|uniref:Probable disease resistance protein RPP1 n=1 Tax=Camelina sativa TaxID=90675 RepID=A0ABM0XYE2_CAMSA|nr:PREDICTED: probable disease resistance protein RPP1 [Camelina sativa]
MASSSSLSTRQKIYDVFPSFSSQDVWRTFLSHFLEGLKSKGIKTFTENRIMRGDSINSELEKAIKESRIAVVILSKNYVSSSKCLNELKLIMECRDTLGQTVMTIFYDVDPSDVRNQTGDFGKAFEETCHGKTEEQKERWTKALNQVAVIAGEHSVSWASEAAMISKIVMDVLNELPSMDFDQLVGTEDHVAKIKSMLRLESDEVKIVGIWGSGGIGKTIIARALYNQVSTNFELKFYKENLGGMFRRISLDPISLKSHLENELHSGILDYRDMKIPDLQEAQFRIKHQRVLLILDDVCSEEIQALANLIQCLKFGSKVIMTNENFFTLMHNGIDQIYKVAFPSSEEALQIFSYSAFGQSSPPRGYLEHANEVANLIAPFPLGLKILGSALRGKSKEEWTMAPAKLKTYVDVTDIEKAIRFAYDGLSKNHKTLFLSLGDSFYWGKNGLYSLSAVNSYKWRDWDIEKGVQTLADLALISISRGDGDLIMMHYLVKLMCKRLTSFN